MTNEIQFIIGRIVSWIDSAPPELVFLSIMFVIAGAVA
jgi:hypothetical protein